MVAALVAGTNAGCSFVFLTPPPPTEERGAIVRCTSSDALPVVDLLIAGWQLVRVLFALNATDADYANGNIGRELDILIGGTALAAFGVSSGYGFSQTTKCREMLAQDYDPDPRPPRGRRPPVPGKVGPPAPAPEKRAADAAGADAGAPEQPDAAPAPAVVVPEKPAEPRAPAVPQRRDPE
jgi:hypothetical protein